MEVLQTELDVSSTRFKESHEVLKSLTNEWRSRFDLVKKGGGEKAIARHKEKKKLTARERIEKLAL